SATAATTTSCLAASSGRRGSSPSVTAAGLRSVSSTIRLRCRAAVSAALPSAAASGSPSSGWSPAIARATADSTPDRGAPTTPAPPPPVEGQQVHPVPGAGGERGEQQRGIHRRVQAGDAADPPGGGAPGVQHDQYLAVAFRAPGAHHDVPEPRGGPPVDGPHVVADHVLPHRGEPP